MTPAFTSVRSWAATAAVTVALTVVPAAQRPKDLPDTRAISHVLNRVGFGARPGDIDRVQALGIPAYVEQQLHPEKIDDGLLDKRLVGFSTLTMSASELASTYFEPAQRLQRQRAAQTRGTAPQASGKPDGMVAPSDPSMAGGPVNGQPGVPARAQSPEARQAAAMQRSVLMELSESRMLRAALSERQLQEVLVDFWFNHFNVFAGKGQVRQYLTEYERDAIRPHTLGNFRELLGAVAHSPAMLFYLDNFQSAGPDTGQSPQLARLNDPRLPPAQRRRLTEMLAARQTQPKRPARGLNENYARELMELHTLGVDAGYTQTDVIELARILTGWTIDQPRNGGTFVFRPAMHDTGSKTLFGVTFKSDGEKEGERALDLLANHPATAHHIALKLAQRFVADQPPPALVDRAAKVFTSTKGDLREVVRSILTSPEFMDPAFRRAKVKTPFEFVVSAVRATGASLTSGTPLVVALQNLGMPLYGCQPPTGYSMTADAWVNTGALLNRMNFALQLVSGGRIVPSGNGRRGAAPPAMAGDMTPGAPEMPRGQGRGRGALAARGPIAIDLSALAPDSGVQSRDRVVDRLLGGEISDSTRQTLAKAETPQNLIALTLGSPEFQRR
ncbi:MAG: DUF1800 domain-containing protein [Vicinamibacterales bacterium]